MTRRIGFIGLVLAGCLLTGTTITPLQAAAGDTKFRVTAGYFDWTIGRGEMDYAFDHDANGDYVGDVHSLDPDSEGGYRIGFEVMQGPVTWMAGYSTWDFDQEDEVRNGNGLSGTMILDDVCIVCQGFDFAMAG